MTIRLKELIGSPYDIVTILKYLPTLHIPATIEDYGSVDNDKFELFHIKLLDNAVSTIDELKTKLTNIQKYLMDNSTDHIYVRLTINYKDFTVCVFPCGDINFTEIEGTDL
jgi:hypothetical protein